MQPPLYGRCFLHWGLNAFSLVQTPHLGEEDTHGPPCCRVFRFDADFSAAFTPHRAYRELGFPAEKLGPYSSPSCTDETHKSARTSELASPSCSVGPAAVSFLSVVLAHGLGLCCLLAGRPEQVTSQLYRSVFIQRNKTSKNHLPRGIVEKGK